MGARLDRGREGRIGGPDARHRERQSRTRLRTPRWSRTLRHTVRSSSMHVGGSGDGSAHAMADFYSRRSFLAGVLAAGMLSTTATYLFTRRTSVTLKLVTGADPTGGRRLLVAMW